MASSTNDDTPLKKAANLLQSVAKPLIKYGTLFLPILINGSNKAYAFYKTLPTNELQFLLGAIFCFFGGVYPTLFAAFQGLEQGGRKTMMEALTALSEEAMIIIEESKKDDKKDDDKDGKADVDQISAKDFVLRKTKLVITKMNPHRVDTAIASMYRTWLAVLAVLKLKFARTIAMALAMSEFMNRPVDRFIAPTVKLATPQEYQKWVPIVLHWITKALAMSVAWYIQAVMSAVTSALSGGLMMSNAFYNICIYRNMNLGGLIKQNRAETYIDEVLAYILAAAGIIFQFKIGFGLPFPFNLLLWPFEISEYYIRWSITSTV